MISSTASAVSESLRWARAELDVRLDAGTHSRASLTEDIKRMVDGMVRENVFHVTPQRRTPGIHIKSVHPHPNIDIFMAETSVQTELMRLEHVMSPGKLKVYARPDEDPRATVQRLYGTARQQQRQAAAAALAQPDSATKRQQTKKK